MGPPATEPAKGERRQHWTRFSPLLAEHANKILGLVVVALLAAAFTVFKNGWVLPRRLEALEIQRARDNTELQALRSLVVDMGEVVFWQGSLSCSAIKDNAVAWAASQKPCGLVSSRTKGLYEGMDRDPRRDPVNR